ncbi:MAG: hypothetical protein KGH57_04190 [Candidatus Micrarchaeota archaeon]|nr:hypothetical protein [Candidatus Micrarchaeota archaeon]
MSADFATKTKENDAQGEATSSKTNTIFCFSLVHDTPQGSEFEKAVKERAPNRESKVIILTEQARELLTDDVIDEYRNAVSSLRSAFESLELYYGDNVSFVHADNTIISALKEACYSAVKKETEEIRKGPLFQAGDQEARRLLDSLEAAQFYITMCTDVDRSTWMRRQIDVAERENPEAQIFLVAGEWHIQDVSKSIQLLKAKGEGIWYSTVDLNDSLTPEIVEGIVKGRKIFADVIKAIGDAPYLELRKDFGNLRVGLAEEGAEYRFVFGGFEEFARQGVLKIAEKIRESGMDLSMFRQPADETKELVRD